MKKKQEEYIPQFDFDNIEEPPKVEYKSCQKCGKQSVSLHNGVCFECRQKKESIEAKQIKEYYKKQDKKTGIIFLIVFFGISVLAFIIMLLISSNIMPADESVVILCSRILVSSISGFVLSGIVTLFKKITTPKNKVEDEE